MKSMPSYSSSFPRLILGRLLMNSGKTMFAQIMGFVPWTIFTRIVARHGGDSGMRCLNFTEQFRAMAFAQLTYRESLRDIEACLFGQSIQAVRHGFSNARQALHLGRCQRRARLAHPGRSRGSFMATIASVSILPTLSGYVAYQLPADMRCYGSFQYIQ